MIEIGNRVEASFFRRWVTVGELKALLNRLDDSDIVYPNRVGNLSICKTEDSDTIGFIDIGFGDLILFKDGDDEPN